MSRAAVLAVVLVVATRAAAAQQDTGAVHTRRDSSATRDTTARDTTKRDTLPHYVPVPPAQIPIGPLPAGTRYSFTTDSFAFSDTRTLADLLAHIPGVYVVRGGQWGSAEAVIYGGRGPAAIEVYWDGVPYLPLGRDSVYLDVGRIPLAPLERVDVVVLPATLRVYLVALRQSSTATSSAIGITTGALSTTGYRADYLKRWKSGVGLNLLADWGGLTGPQGSSTASFNDVNLWLQGEYIPTPRAGVTFALTSVDWSRSGTVPPGPTVNPAGSTRQDQIARFFWSAHTDGLGPHFDLTLAKSSVTNDSLVPNETLSQASLAFSDAGPRASAKLTATTAGARIPLSVQGEAGWMPLDFVTVSVDARHARYSFARTGDRAHAALGLRLPLGFSAHGEVAWTDDLAASILPADTAQQGMDLYGALRFERSWMALEVGGARRAGFTPPTAFLNGISTVQALNTTQPTNYLSVQALLRPLPGLTLSAWYFDPVRGGGDFEPPHHARYSATFYSKFWRTYKSGVFACRIEAAGESWSGGGEGGLAIDSAGTITPLGLPGATFVDLNVQIRVAGVTIYWTVRNARAARASFVPGLDYLSNYQVYGVLWRFTN